MALTQVSLKLKPDVLEDWRCRADEAGFGRSIRDWLIALAGSRIALQPDLLAKVSQIADRRRQSVTAIVTEALEAYVAGDQILSAGDDDLAQRVADLERRIERLETIPPDCQNYPGFGKELEDIWSDFLESMSHMPSTRMLIAAQSRLARVDQFRAVLQINKDWLGMAKSRHDEIQYAISEAAGRLLILVLEAKP